MTHPEEFSDTSPQAMEVWLNIWRWLSMCRNSRFESARAAFARAYGWDPDGDGNSCFTLCASIKGTTNKSYWTSADTWSIIDPRFPKMIELLRLVLPGAIGWLTAKSAYTLLSPGFVQRRPAVAACVVGSMMGLAIPAAMIALSRLA